MLCFGSTNTEKERHCLLTILICFPGSQCMVRKYVSTHMHLPCFVFLEHDTWTIQDSNLSDSVQKCFLLENHILSQLLSRVYAIEESVTIKF